ncbi:2Fe-2S iron-sulfur cluster-binding protein [Methylocapsa acidiphila]|uniref:2Fe-2S iron-sulfur cluster-binding protein n=1 Tax=Methylocapsa acidiphila TaxID=133552 RepID=UPI000427AC6A|nr:2Fe-2S iron-sulfur cluster-binding protein [Methylocapsa acidiphila]
MPTITIKPSGKTQEAAEGTTILAALQAAGIPIECTCESKNKYDPCHLFVLEGKKGLKKLVAPESERLDAMVGVGSKSRLACQCVLNGTENVTVELLGALSG